MQKTKRETKELGRETHTREGVVKKEKFPNTRKPSYQWACREFWNLRVQHDWVCPQDFPGKNNGVGCHFLL